MSDAGLTTDSAPVGVPSAEGTPAPSPQATSASPSGPDPLAELPADRAVFDRGYVESVRQEAARYRGEATNAKAALGEYDQVFGVYEPEDRRVWMDLARTWVTDPSRAAAVMQQIASSVLGDGGPPNEPNDRPTPGVADPPYPDNVIPLTPDKIQELIQEGFAARDAEAAQQRAVEDVFSELRAGGFDPTSAEGFMVLYNANHFTGGDIPKAIEMTNQYKQQIIDGYVQGRTGSAAMPAPSGSAATGAPPEIKNFDDARRATEAFLRERRQAG